MDYFIEKVSPDSSHEMVAFLKNRENYTLFLLGNFEDYGPTLKTSPHSGNYKLIRSASDIVGVFSLTKNGALLIESTVQKPIFDLVIKACQQESIPWKGLIGNESFCSPFWDYLKAKKIFLAETFTSKEILYTLCLDQNSFSPQNQVRQLNENDYDQWRDFRLKYYAEIRFPNLLTENELFDQFLLRVRKKIVWGFFFDNTLASVADLNAKTFDLGQVGGVYTAKKFRQKGLAQAVMKHLSYECASLHKMRKLIIFTGETNLSAQKLYLSLKASEVGFFSLYFGK